MSNLERSKAELIGTVLERIAEDQYSVSEDEESSGEVITIFDPGKTPEEFFAESLEELRNIRKESGIADNNLPLEQDWSDEWTLKLLELESFGSEEREWMFPVLAGKSYDEVIDYLYHALKDSKKDIEGMLAAGREIIRTPKPEESVIDLDNLPNLHNDLANFYARRLSRQFGKIVDRGEKLALLRTDYEVPSSVRRYTEEASKCYLNGLWIACLIVCRSAIEFAIRDRLITLGHTSELDAFEKSQKGDSLKYLLELAKGLLPWQMTHVLQDAQKVRDVARRAVHVGCPDENECRDMFLLTRTIVHTLYAGF